MNKGGKTWIWWTIAIVVILVIILLIIFLPSSDQPEPGNWPCNTQGFSCLYGSQCPEEFAEVDLSCPGGSVCCNQIIKTKEQCESLGYICKEHTEGCGEGYISVGGCSKNEICCKTTKPNIFGYASLKEGNCMPPIGEGCTTIYIDTEIAIFPKVDVNDLDGTYYRPTIGPIITTTSDSGYYEITVDPGEYSVFAKDPTNDEYYCNDFTYYGPSHDPDNNTGPGGYACVVYVEYPIQFDIIIDHSVN